MESPRPPIYVVRFFRWFTKPTLRDSIEGDLMELYTERCAQFGKRKADLRFIVDVLLLIRPQLLRTNFFNKPTELFMYKSYFKIGWRNLIRNKSYAFINLIGLAIGLACCLLISIYIQHELSFDNYHKNLGRIYRVVHFYGDEQTPVNYAPAASEFQVWGNAPVGPALEKDFPEIEKVVQFSGRNSALLANGALQFQEDDVFFVDATVFDVFSWKMLAGDPNRALIEPNTMVLTESTARKYFGNVNAVGQMVRVDNAEEFMVTGVIEDVPANSHFSFDVLLSMSSFKAMRPEIFDWWGYVDFYTYFLLPESHDLRHFKSKIPEFVQRNVEQEQHYAMDVEPLKDVYLHSEAKRQPGTRGSLATIYIFAGIAAFILLIACFNFINLATARSLERAKEIGVRKVAGAGQFGLLQQFLIESILIAFAAALIAIALAGVVLPAFNELSGRTFQWKSYEVLRLVALLSPVSLVVGLFAGFYPALVLSNFNPALVLKGFTKSHARGAGLRKVLVVFQFALSVILIAGTAVVFSQLKFMQERDLGFSREQMLVLDFNWDTEVQKNIESIKNELRAVPSVSSVSAQRAVPGGHFPQAGTKIIDANGEMLHKALNLYEVDFDFIGNYELEMAAGRAYSRDFPEDSLHSLVVNEAAAKLYGYASPEEIIGAKFSQWGKEGTVVGVVKDFNYESLHKGIEPLALRLEPQWSISNIAIKLNSANINQSIREIESVWKTLVPHRPLLYSFQDQSFDLQYQSDNKFARVFSAFSGLAIFIACLGLIGLVAYTTEKRTKEIGIRKVLGASVLNISFLVSKDFIKLVVIAILMAIPFTWYMMDRWLEGFEYRISLNWGVFVATGVVAVMIALLTVSYQSIKASVANPIDSLRTE